MQGLKTAALYSFPPGRFGLCGMGGEHNNAVFRFLMGEKIPQIKEILESFEGSNFYYQLIAKENEMRNSFEEKVVRAYWIGNELLEKVEIGSLKKMVREKIKKPQLSKMLPHFSKPHHSFHVLVAGPVKKDLVMTEGMKDLCKISWGKILKIEKLQFPISKLTVEYQPLLKEKEWFLGKPQKREIFWDKRILPKIKVGDIISFHWDFALEKLSKKDLTNLKKYTELSIKTANIMLRSQTS